MSRVGVAIGTKAIDKMPKTVCPHERDIPQKSCFDSKKMSIFAARI